jgi:hypothetical protein
MGEEAGSEGFEMANRSKKNRNEKSGGEKASAVNAGSAAVQTAQTFYLPEKPANRHKILLAITIFMELLWIAYLIFLSAIK